MTRTAFCRKSPRVPRVCWLGSWALGTSDRGGQDKANCRSRLPSVARGCLHIGFGQFGLEAARCGDAAFDAISFVSGVQTPSLAMCGERETAALALTQVILRFSTTAAFTLAGHRSASDRRLMASNEDDFRIRPGKVRD